jgi:hypothetical protein
MMSKSFEVLKNEHAEVSTKVTLELPMKIEEIEKKIVELEEEGDSGSENELQVSQLQIDRIKEECMKEMQGMASFNFEFRVDDERNKIV